MEIYRRIWPYLKRYRLQVVIGLALSITQYFLLTQIPIWTGEALGYLKWLGNERHGMNLDSVSRVMWDYSLLIIGLILIGAICMAIKRWLVISASRHIEYDMRNDIFRKIQGLSQTYFDQNKTGDIMAKATNDLDAVRLVIGPGVMYPVDTLIVLIIAYTVMFQIDPWMTATTIFPAVGLIGVMVFFRERMFRFSRQVQDQFGAVSALVRENLNGLRVVRAYGREETERDRFAEQSREYIHRNLHLAKVQAAFRPMLFMVLQYSLFIIILIGAIFVYLTRINFDQLVKFFGLFQMMIWPLIAIGFVFGLIQRGNAALQRMTDLLDYETDIPDLPNAHNPDEGLRGHLEFHGLTFAYPATTTPALVDIHLDVEPGHTLGIIGPTGAGKSTLVNLLTRMYPVDEERIVIDGVPIERWASAKLRAGIGIVTQQTFLFSDTIAQNIAFGGDGEIDMARVEEAGRIAQLEGAVADFPNGYRTLLGERGVNLSGGQKQRTAIARAIYRDPSILILDDALSAVDTQTEHKILEGLREVMRDRTTLLISHRVSTVQLADEIVFLDDGRVVERGSHDELVVLDGRYAELHREQTLASELDEL